MLTPNDRWKISATYFKLLNSLDWTDELLIRGMREGLTKFVTNSILLISKEKKYLQGDFYSEAAANKIKNNDFTNLVYEHMVPKSKYIQKPCEELAKSGELTIEIVDDLLEKYWKIAIITKEEDKKLPSTTMTNTWDGKNIFYRYNISNIDLFESEKINFK